MLAVSRSRRVLGALAGLVLAVGPGVAGAQVSFRLRTIVEENVRTDFGTFRNLAVAGVTRQGQVMFLADRKDFRDGDDQGLFLWVDGRTVRLIGRDDPVPGGKIRAITRAALAPRTAATRVFLATVRGDGGAEFQALFVAAQSRVRQIARVGETIGPGRLLALDPTASSLQVNSSGEVLFLAQLDLNGNGTFDAATDTIALFLYTGGQLRLLQRVGDTVAGGQVQQISLGQRALNDRGRAAWELNLATSGTAIVVADRGRIRRAIHSGDAVPLGRLLRPADAVLNEPGNVAFTSPVDRNGNGTFDAGRDESDLFLFRPEGSPPFLTLLRSSRLERGASDLGGALDLDDFNRATAVAEVDTNQNGRLDGSDREAIYLASTAGVAAVARAGRQLRVGGDPRGGELRLNFGQGAVRMNNRGEVALGGFVDVDGSGDFDPTRDQALILFWNGGSPIAVARDGQIFFGPLSEGLISGVRGPDGITDAGVIVFTADLDRDADGRIDPDNEGRAIFFAVPTGRR